MKNNIIYVLLAVMMLTSCSEEQVQQYVPARWNDIEAQAKNSTVTLMMWMGDPQINAYMKNVVTPYIKEKYGITLNIVQGQGSQIVQNIIAQRQAGRTGSAVDMCWINGETFYQLRQLNGLFGPFVHRLPNAKYVDTTDPIITTDFQQKTDGYESPWGTVQLSFIYNSARVPKPPSTLQELQEWVMAHPGRYTISTEFTGMTVLKSWMIALMGGEGAMAGKFSEEQYAVGKKKLFAYLRSIQPFLWKRGRTFPQNVSEMHRLFLNGEIDFTMSNNDAEAENKTLVGQFPVECRGYVMRSGSIRNTHYQGILASSKNIVGAMVVCNALLSPELQSRKMHSLVWGDGTVLKVDWLPPEKQLLFDTIPTRLRVEERKIIRQYQLSEIAPEYMIRLFDDFRNEIIEQRWIE